VVCQALKAPLDECPVKLGGVRADKLKAALTCFPAAQSLTLVTKGKVPAADKSEMVKVLREHGSTLQRVVAAEENRRARQLLESAVRAGALPKLSYFELILADWEHRQWLSDGTLGLVEEMILYLEGVEDLAELQPLRQLSHLRDLRIVGARPSLTPVVGAPPFTPPSLETLNLWYQQDRPLVSLLRELPSMLQASGASLKELDVGAAFNISGDGGAALAQVLRTCSPTLKALHIHASDRRRGGPTDTFASEVALGLASCCKGLE
jgi:hypothetical protein